MKGLLVLCVALALAGLAAPARALEGRGFTEQILSCVGGSKVTVQVQRGQLVMVRLAPECDPQEPVLFKATKDRVVRVTASKDGRAVKHVVAVRVS